ncbi:hypothetical protein WN51_00917 [Melipona quadrifasciata]|uniref:Uncharacterized protein n=1 Tax=Melipona quadrifasciata TaxID=166423 RepID=A0A0M8ZXG3_9HYME|nr:hypothetical protein WN51_00917 [Melipona quadrifasciata]
MCRPNLCPQIVVHLSLDHWLVTMVVKALNIEFHSMLSTSCKSIKIKSSNNSEIMAPDVQLRTDESTNTRSVCV